MLQGAIKCLFKNNNFLNKKKEFSEDSGLFKMNK